MSKRREFVFVFLAGILFCWGSLLVSRAISPQGASLVPAVLAESVSDRPISTGELETTSAPVTVSRPLEVPDLYAFQRELDLQTTQVVIVDSEKKRICVYHVGEDGSIEFVANRNFTWDLTLDVYNEKGLTPSQIREYYESNRAGR